MVLVRRSLVSIGAFLLALGSYTSGALGQRPEVQEEATQAMIQATPRPRIGLVLSGGGARGAAHIGVLKVLEEVVLPLVVEPGEHFELLVEVHLLGEDRVVHREGAADRPPDD